MCYPSVTLQLCACSAVVHKTRNKSKWYVPDGEQLTVNCGVLQDSLTTTSSFNVHIVVRGQLSLLAEPKYKGALGAGT